MGNKENVNNIIFTQKEYLLTLGIGLFHNSLLEESLQESFVQRIPVFHFSTGHLKKS